MNGILEQATKCILRVADWLPSLDQGLLRISAKSDTCFGKYSDSRFGLNSDTFRSGATLGQDS